MTRTRSFVTMLLALMLAAMWAPATAMAFDDDDMSFDVDDVEPISEDDMTFAPGEAERAASAPGDVLGVAVVAIPSDDLAGEDRIALQNELRTVMDSIRGYMSYGDNTVLPGLEDRDTLTCVREPLCLSSVGRSAGVDRILIGRVARTADGYQLNVDLFDVHERLFLRYHTSTHSSFGTMLEAVRPGVNEVFGIRGPRVQDDGVDDRELNLKRIMAYTTAGVAVASLGTGIYFGTRVGSLEDEFNALPKTDGRYESLTQVQAQQKIRDMENAATTANVFYGIAAGTAIVSILLFVIDSDEADPEATDRRSPTWRNVRMAPAVSADSVGFGAWLNF